MDAADFFLGVIVGFLICAAALGGIARRHKITVESVSGMVSKVRQLKPGEQLNLHFSVYYSPADGDDFEDDPPEGTSPPFLQQDWRNQ